MHAIEVLNLSIHLAANNIRNIRTCGSSRVHPVKLAEALIAERNARETIEAATKPQAEQKVSKSGLLGCWINGTLKFQSRNHDNVHDYARARMAERNNVWVAPVGSFNNN